jgi:hypothetical protein
VTAPRTLLAAVAAAALLCPLLPAPPSLGAPPAPAPAGPAAAAGVEQRTQRAKQAFAAGRYNEALELFVKLYAETLDPLYLRVIGRCYQKLEDPDHAIDSFREYLRKAKKLAPDKRKEIEGFIAEMEALRAQQSEKAARADALVEVPLPAGSEPRGATALPEAPAGASPSALAAPPPAAGADPLIATSSPGGRQSDDVSPPLYTRWWFWTAVAAVVATGVVVGVLVLRPDESQPYMGGDGFPIIPPGEISIPSR